MVVAALLILMAATVLIHTCFIFGHQIAEISHLKPNSSAAEQTVAGHPDTPSTGGHSESPAPRANIDKFDGYSLEILSSILFAVIILELLRTIITYLQTHDILAIMQEFLVVGIISSVRKILLVGAEASLSGSSGMEFIQEAVGVLLNIGGIVLLILGLVMLRRVYGKKSTGTGKSGEGSENKTDE
jgi:uncharacterized membrane protein (DUF373 family)